MSLLISFLIFLFIIEIRVLKSQTIIVELFLPLFCQYLLSLSIYNSKVIAILFLIETNLTFFTYKKYCAAAALTLLLMPQIMSLHSVYPIA